MRLFVGFLALFVSVLAQATIQEDFELLRDSRRDYKIIGTVCEEVARLELARTYRPPMYYIETGIAYGDKQRTIGELDVIVFENKSANVVMVGEVKCWKNMQDGLAKAHDQRQRFISTMKSGRTIYFESTSDHKRYDQSLFSNVQSFITVAQKGSRAVGYDVELDYPLDELMQLRSMMIRCQDEGQCARP